VVTILANALDVWERFELYGVSRGDQAKRSAKTRAQMDARDSLDANVRKKYFRRQPLNRKSTDHQQVFHSCDLSRCLDWLESAHYA